MPETKQSPQHLSPSSEPTILFQVDNDITEKFIALLQSGIEIHTVSGESLLAFLEKLPGFTHEYIESEVQTIFLDGTAIDDINAPITGNATVALSAAMPGLSGAIFRRNSIHAQLRTVQHQATDTAVPQQITVKLKLFNTIGRDHGQSLMKKGISINALKLIAFLQAREWLLPLLSSVKINKQSVSPEDLLLQLGKYKVVRLQLTNDLSI